jgi:hypothetical protein
MMDRQQFPATRNDHFDFNHWPHITWREEDNL